MGQGWCVNGWFHSVSLLYKSILGGGEVVWTGPGILLQQNVFWLMNLPKQEPFSLVSLLFLICYFFYKMYTSGSIQASVRTVEEKTVWGQSVFYGDSSVCFGKFLYHPGRCGMLNRPKPVRSSADNSCLVPAAVGLLTWNLLWYAGLVLSL